MLWFDKKRISNTHIYIEDIIALAIVCSPRSHSCDPPLRDRDYRKAISVLLQQDASGFYYIGKPISIPLVAGLSLYLYNAIQKKSRMNITSQQRVDTKKGQ